MQQWPTPKVQRMYATIDLVQLGFFPVHLANETDLILTADAGKFPKPVFCDNIPPDEEQLRWLEDDLIAWQDERARLRDQQWDKAVFVARVAIGKGEM